MSNNDRRLRLYIHTVGCAKNLVDSEILAGELVDNFELVEAAIDADVAVINTCGFIEEASATSVDAVLEAIELKKQSKLQSVFVMGCMTQKHGAEMQREIPGIDGIVGVNQFGELLQKMGVKHPHGKVTRPLPEMFRDRQMATPAHYSHLRIADGCDNKCTYCAIPSFRGAYHSRAADDIIKEAVALEENGARELLIIGQEITSWGKDFDQPAHLAELLHRLHQETEVDWLRLMYTHPPDIDQRLIDTLAELPRILPYLDYPVEHLVDSVLKRMNRRQSWDSISRDISRIRKAVPGIALRTSIIVGFPGETDADFELLLERVKETGFERLGAFPYSDGEEVPARLLPNQVPEALRQERFERLMELQRGLSLVANQKLVGTVQEVLFDEIENNVSLGRTRFDAPEIDNTVLVAGEITPGSLLPVTITDATEYDLYGELLPQSGQTVLKGDKG